MKERKEREKQEINLNVIPTQPLSHVEFQSRLLLPEEPGLYIFL